MSNSASRADLVDHVASELNLSKVAAKNTVNTVLKGIEALTFAHGSLTIRDFGKFSARKRAARTVKSGVMAHSVSVPERTALAFTCSKNLVRA